MNIQGYLNWLGIDYLLFDEGNNDMAHFRVQTDSRNAIVAIENCHNGFYAVRGLQMNKETGEWEPFVHAFSHGKILFEGKADDFTEDILDATCKTAVRILKGKYPQVCFIREAKEAC